MKHGDVNKRFLFQRILVKISIISTSEYKFSSMSDNSRTIFDVTEYIERCKEFSKEYDTLCELTEKTLEKLLSFDEFLSDIPYDLTQEEILSKVI